MVEKSTTLDSEISIKNKQESEYSLSDKNLWQGFLLKEDGDINEWAKKWLTIQCLLMDASLTGCLFIRHDRTLNEGICWPNASFNTVNHKKAAELCIKQSKSVVLPITTETPQRKTSIIATTIIDNGLVLAVVCIEIPSQSPPVIELALRQIQWGSASLRSELAQKVLIGAHSGADKSVDNRFSTRMVLASTEFTRFKRSTQSLVTRWAAESGCERVSLGFVRGQNIKIAAVSQQTEFDKKLDELAAIRGAMLEAVDQKESIYWPNNDSRSVNRCHESLSALGHSDACSTILLMKPSHPSPTIYGALTFEHHQSGFFSPERRAMFEQAALLVAPILLQSKENDKPALLQLLDEMIISPSQKLFGRRYYSLKVGAAFFMVLVALLVFVDVPHKVSAGVTLEGWQERSLSAADDGFLLKSHVKAGDNVTKGLPLVSMDDRDLQLEHRKWTNKKHQLEKQHVEALVKQESDKAGVFLSQIRQANAQLQLLEEQLRRTDITAPFDGVIIEGDLSQRQGSPVERGEPLLKISPLNHYRLALQVNERDIRWVRIGQQGTLKLSSMINQDYSFRVKKISPVSEVQEGENQFLVEAEFLTKEAIDGLLPGMQGKAKIYINHRNITWVWTHRLVDWLKLWRWSWWP